MLARATTTSRAIGDPAQGVPTPAPAAPAPATSELPAAQSPKLAAFRRVVVVALAPACSLSPVSSLSEPVAKSSSRQKVVKPSPPSSSLLLRRLRRGGGGGGPVEDLVLVRLEHLRLGELGVQGGLHPLEPLGVEVSVDGGAGLVGEGAERLRHGGPLLVRDVHLQWPALHDVLAMHQLHLLGLLLNGHAPFF